MELYKGGQKIRVIDGVNGVHKDCNKISVFSYEENLILIHFINWNDSYDEWINIDSD